MKKSIRELMKYAGKYKRLTFISLIFSGVSAVLALIPFVYLFNIMKEAIEVMPNFNNATNMVHNGWMAVLFATLSMIIYFAGLMCSHISAFRVATNIKSKLMDHITKIPIGASEKIGSGRLRKIVMESSGATESFLAHQLPDLVGAVITPICMIIILFIFDWKLGILSLIPTVLGFLSMTKMAGKAMQNDMKKYQSSLEEMNNEAVEYVRGMPIIKTFGQTLFHFKKFRKSIDDYSKFCMAYTKKCRKPMLMFQVFINSTFAFLIGVALYVSAKNNITDTFVLNLLFYIIYTPIIATTMTKIMFMNENLMAVQDAIERINNILKIKLLEEKNNGMRIKDNSIDIDNISFKYDDSDSNAIDNINIRIKPNSTIAFVGPSGGGKTTLANLITRFYDVNKGSIKIGNVDIRDISKEELMNTVSFVFQDSKLFKTSIYENIKMAKPDATRKEIMEALELAQCKDIIDRLPNGIDTVIGTNGVYFSGGEVQRIAIARVMLKNTPIIILDEATAFADPENELKIQKAFENLAKNKTVIMIAHRLSTIKNVNTIYVLKEGKVIESGTHDELINKNGIYNKMWNDYQTSISWKVGA